MLRLIPPGKRGNKYWVARGRVNGRLIEKSTGATNKKDAERCCAEFAAILFDESASTEQRTFAYAAAKYIEARQPQPYDVKRIALLCEAIGDRWLEEIRQADIVDAASLICPDAHPATKNRDVITPAAAVLHYAAQNEWCRWLRISKFREPRAKTRYVTDAHEEWLLQATADNAERHLLILWLFRQGDRISDVLRVRMEDCDLKRQIVRRHVAKTDTYTELPLDADICAALAKWPRQSGRIFARWKDQRTVNHWLRRLCNGLEIAFTPHRARHTVGKRLSDSGASLRTIMTKLTHANVQSSMRYQAGDIETVRAASELAKRRGA
jgi:integrase